MAQAQEIAKLYYTLDAKVGEGQGALDDQIEGLEELSAAAEQLGIPLGELRGLIARFAEEADPASAAAEALAEAMEHLQEVTAEGLQEISAQTQLYSQGTRIAGLREASVQRLGQLEEILKARLAEGNLSLERRIAIESQLARVQGAIAVGLAEGAKAAGQGGEAAKVLGDRWGNAALQITSAAGSIVQAGTVSGGAMKGILLGATGLVGILGTGGALVAAAGVAANAIITLFTRARDEAKRSAQETLDEIKRLADQTKTEVDRALGRQENVAAQIAKKQAEIARLQRLTRNSADIDPESGAYDVYSSLLGRLAEAQKELLELEKASGLAAVQTGKARTEAVERELGGLQQLIAAGRATAADRARATEIEGRLREELAGVNTELANAIRLGKGVEEREQRIQQAQTRRIEILRALGQLEKTQSGPPKEDRTAQSVRDLQQAFSDLVRTTTPAKDEVAEFDKKVRELTDGFTDLRARMVADKKPVTDLDAAFAAFQKKAEEARKTLQRLNGARAAKELREITASLTPTLVDDYALAIENLTQRLDDLGASPQQKQEILGLQKLIQDATLAAQRLDEEIAAIRGSGGGALAQLSQLDKLRVAQETELLAITGQGADVDRQRLAVRTRLAKIEEAMAAITGDYKDNLADITQSTSTWADLLDNAASAAFGIASALGGADSIITRMIGSVAQVASGIAKVVDLAGKTKGGLSALFSTSGGIASALPGLGAIVGGGLAVASLFRGQKTPPSPEQQELIRIQKANNQRLADLKLSLDKAAKFSVGGGLVAAVRDVALTEQRPITDGVLGGSGLTSEVGRSVSAVLAELKRLGVGIEELRSIARDAGIELSDNPTLDQIKQLQEYLQTQTLASLFSGLEGKLRKLELAAQLDPEAFDGIPGIMARLKILTGDDGIPAIAEALAGLDPASPTYLQDVIAALTQLGLTADQLDLSKLGGLSPDEFLAEIIKLVTGIRTATPQAKTAAEKFAAAMEAYNTQLEFGTITVEERLNLARAKFRELFPALADAIDLSSVEAFEASIQAIIDGFAADGELTDAEKAQIAVLEQVREAFRGAASEAEKFVDALSVLATEFDLFDTSFSDQFKRLRDEGIKKFAESFPGLGDLFAGIDFDTPEGRATLAERFREWFAAAAADGLTEEENAIAQWFRDILGIGEQIADEEARKAEELLREAQAKRDGILQAAEDYIAALDIDDPVEQFIIRANAIKRAFPGLTAALEQFDLATEEGRAAFEAWVESLFSSPEKLQAAADAAGLTLEQFIEAILGLEAASDNATARVRTLGEALDEAFSEVDFGVALEGITDPIERLVRTANAAIGVDAKIRDALGGLDLRTEEGRKAAEAALVQLGQSTTDKATRDAILRILDGIRGITPSGAPGEVAAGRTADPTREDTSRAQFVAEDVRFAQLLDYSSRTAVAVEGMLALLSARGPLIAPPVLPPQAATAAAIFGGASALAAGQVSAERGAGLSVAITLTFPGTVYLGSEEQAREILTPAIVEALLQASGRQLQVDRQLRGKGTR